MKKNFGIGLDIELKLALDILAESQQVSSSWLINELVKEYVLARKDVQNGDMDIIKDFFSKNVIIDSLGSVNSFEVYKMYKYWSEANKYEILPRITFTKRFIQFSKDKGVSYVERKHTGMQSVFNGIRLIELKIWESPK